MNDKWECYLCAEETDFDVSPKGYLGNYHPLCSECADFVLYNESHTERFRLTYHEQLGDILIIANIPIEQKKPNLN